MHKREKDFSLDNRGHFKKKTLSYLAICVLFFLFIPVLQPLAYSFLKKGIVRSAEYLIGQTLDYEALVWKNNALHFKKVRLQDRESQKEKEGASLFLEELEILYSFHLEKAFLNLQANIEGFQLELPSTAEGKNILKRWLKPSKPLRFIRSRIEIERGYIALLDEIQDLPLEVSLSFDQRSDEFYQLDFHLRQRKNHIQGFFYQKNGDKNFKLKVKEWEGSSIYDLFNFASALGGLKQLYWKNITGVLQGELSSHCSQDSFPSMQAYFEVFQVGLEKGDGHYGLCFPLIKLELETSQKKNQGNSLSFQHLKEHFTQNTYGKLTCSPGSQCYSLDSQGAKKVRVNFFGRADFFKHQPTKLNLLGDVYLEDHFSPFCLEALGFMKLPKGDLELKIQHPSLPISQFRISIDPSSQKESKLLVSLKDLKASELMLLKGFFEPHLPSLEALEVKNGIVSAQLRGLLRDRSLSQIEVRDLFISQMDLYHFLDFQRLSRVQLSGHFTLPKLEIGSVGDLHGELMGACKSLVRHDNLFEDIEGFAKVEKGKLQTAKARVKWEKIKGELDWDAQRISSPLKLNLGGHVEDFLPLFPPHLRAAYHSKFKEDQAQVVLDGHYQFPIWDCRVKARLGSDPEIAMNFKIQKHPTASKKQSEQDVFFTSVLAHQSTLPTLRLMDRYPFFTPLSGYCLLEGQFRGEQLDIEKYIMPLFHHKSAFFIQGKANLMGQFNSDTLEVFYSNYNFEVDHSDVKFKFSDPSGKRVGAHYFHLNTKKHFGHLDFENASCFVKEQGVCFENLRGKLFLQPEGAYVPHLQGVCLNLPMSGEVFLTLLSNTQLDLKIRKIQGKDSFDTFNQFFKAFNIDSLDSLPLLGEVEVFPASSMFHLVRGLKTHYEMKIRGHFYQKDFGQEESKWPLQDLSTDFFYDGQTLKMELRNLKAKLFPSQKESLDLLAHSFSFPLDKASCSPFEVKVQNDSHTLGSLKGKCFFNPIESLGSFELVLDHSKSHLGPLDLNQVSIQFIDYEPRSCFVDFQLQLERLLEEKKLLESCIHQTLPFDTSSFFSGKLMGQWVYSTKESCHQFSCWGDQIRGPYENEGPLSLKGKLKEKTLYIDELKYNKLKLTLKCKELQKTFFLEDLRGFKEQDFYLNLSGHLNKSSLAFEGDIHKLIASAEAFKSWLPPEAQSLEGKVDVKGQIECSNLTKKVDLFIDVAGKMSGLKSSLFTWSSEPFVLRLRKSDQTVSIPYFKGKIRELYGKKCPLDIIVKNFSLEKPFNTSALECLHFRLPAECLEDLEALFSPFMSTNWSTHLVRLKKKGWLEGSVSYQPKRADYTLSVSLQDGNYLLNQKSYSISDLLYQSGPMGHLLKAKLYFGSYPYWVFCQQDSYLKDHLFFTLYDKNPQKTQMIENRGLVCQLTQKDEGGWNFKTLSGSVGGLKMNWIKVPEAAKKSTQCFKGQVQVEDSEAFDRLKDAYFPKLKSLPFGEGYYLSGKLDLDLAHLSRSSFKGLLGGQNYNLLGYLFKSLSSEITINAKELTLKDLKLTDLSGEMSAPKISFKKEEKKLLLEMPFLKIDNLRPSLLKKKGGAMITHKPLVIDRMELKNLKGDLNHLNTLLGEGSVKFRKSIKKPGSLLNLPSHLISKLGLDLKMLNPVEGKIFYEIKNEKFLITRLQDMYSQDRNCHFNVLKGPESYLDFEGNLKVRIKMKQYVLLKFTEPYIISIVGPFLDPHFSLQRRKVIVDVPLQSSP